MRLVIIVLWLIMIIIPLYRVHVWHERFKRTIGTELKVEGQSSTGCAITNISYNDQVRSLVVSSEKLRCWKRILHVSSIPRFGNAASYAC